MKNILYVLPYSSIEAVNWEPVSKKRQKTNTIGTRATDWGSFFNIEEFAGILESAKTRGIPCEKSHVSRCMQSITPLKNPRRNDPPSVQPSQNNEKTSLSFDFLTFPRPRLTQTICRKPLLQRNSVEFSNQSPINLFQRANCIGLQHLSATNDTLSLI